MEITALILLIFGIFRLVPLAAAETLENFLDSNFVSNGTCKVSGCSSSSPWNKNSPICVKLKFSTHRLKTKTNPLKGLSFFVAQSVCDVKSAACYGVKAIEVPMKNCPATRSGSQAYDFTTRQRQTKWNAKHGLRSYDSVESRDSINRESKEHPPTDSINPTDSVEPTENLDKYSKYTEHTTVFQTSDYDKILLDVKEQHKRTIDVWRGCKPKVSKKTKNETEGITKLTHEDAKRDDNDDNDKLGCKFTSTIDKKSNKTKDGPLRIFKNQLQQRQNNKVKLT